MVREWQGSPGQYVLTGMQGGIKKHLLLVDPEGIVWISLVSFNLLLYNPALFYLLIIIFVRQICPSKKIDSQIN